MRYRALLIGAPLDDLEGVRNDVAAMEAVLVGRGFDVARRVGAAATRAGILAAYDELISATRPGDGVVVYYSGHGGHALPLTDDLRTLQFIAPVDYRQTKPDDFRGIASDELSALLTRLTERTGNATVILDCCHAGRMSRDPSLHTRALLEPASYDVVRAHIDRLRIRSAASRSRPAVRIVACGPGELAYEYRGRAGQRIGMLTEALVDALTEAGDTRITWAALMDRVRRRVLELAPTQRPEVEGPSRRFVFDVAEDDAVSALRVVVVDGGRGRLENAALFGVRPGDEFLVLPPGSTGDDRRDAVAELLVEDVGALHAEGPLTFWPGRDRVPLGARAYRSTTSAAAFPVLIPGGDPRADELVRAVSSCASLRVAGPDERWRAALRVGAGGELTVWDRLGPLHAPGTAAAAIRDLRALAQAAALLQASATNDWPLGAEVAVQWGTLRRGTRRQLPRSGAGVRVGEHVFIDVRNNGFADVFVSLVDIGVAGRISVLTQDSSSGVVVPPGGRHAFGATIGWPDGIDVTTPRPETVLVFVTAHPHDVSALEQDGVHHRSRRPKSTPLERQLGRVVRIDRRIAEPELELRGPRDGYDVHRVEFELDPDPVRPSEIE